MDSFNGNNQFIFHNSLNCLGDFLEKFSESNYFSVLLKDAETEKHILANQVCADKWALTPQAMVGTTIHEIYDRVQSFKNKDSVIERVKQAEHTALQAHYQTNETYTILLYDGTVSVQQSAYIPVFGMDKHPIAIFILTYDLTRYTRLLYLLKIYDSYYSSKSKAIQKLLDYLKITTYFCDRPSIGEVKVLLAMSEEPRATRLAEIIQLSPKTIAGYIASLRDKLKPNIDLYSVLSHLRAGQQWFPKHEVLIGSDL